MQQVKSVYNPPCPVKAQSKSKENQKINQKKKSQKRIREKTPCASVIIRERFFDLSSVAAGSQSAMQQYYLPTIYIKKDRDKPCHNSFCEPAATE